MFVTGREGHSPVCDPDRQEGGDQVDNPPLVQDAFVGLIVQVARYQSHKKNSTYVLLEEGKHL